MAVEAGVAEAAAAEGVADRVAEGRAAEVTLTAVDVRPPWAGAPREPDLTTALLIVPGRIPVARTALVQGPVLQPAGPTLQVPEPALEPPTLRAVGPRTRS